MDKNPHLPGSADDILGIAYLGLVNAYKGFNPTGFNGIDGGQIKFSTYAVRTINGTIRRYINDFGRTIRKSRDGRGPDNIDSLDRRLNDNENSPITLGDVVPAADCKMNERVIINDFLSQVDPRSREIYRLRILGLSQREISKIIGVSQANVSRTKKRFYDLARKYGRQEVRNC